MARQDLRPVHPTVRTLLRLARGRARKDEEVDPVWTRFSI